MCFGLQLVGSVKRKLSGGMKLFFDLRRLFLYVGHAQQQMQRGDVHMNLTRTIWFSGRIWAI